MKLNYGLTLSWEFWEANINFCFVEWHIYLQVKYYHFPYIYMLKEDNNYRKPKESY